jgi:hypothetical protein
MTPLPKPLAGRACNGCGLCCIREVCDIGLEIYGQETPAPCPGLLAHNGRYLCKVVLAEAAGGMAPVAALILGIGHGCDTIDDVPPLQPEEMPA